MRFVQAMLGHADLKSTDLYARGDPCPEKAEIHTATHPARLEQREQDSIDAAKPVRVGAAPRGRESGGRDMAADEDGQQRKDEEPACKDSRDRCWVSTAVRNGGLRPEARAGVNAVPAVPSRHLTPSARN
ncbi:hypothetical protein PWP93_27060 [Paraburkholderia sp. A1RI-2L]|uniref:hypothetical protein n=1 Tax=Paraburkholderia sp. A1RI-2L TaxID=3028367 RepID=UPI003B7828E8